ncbi:peptidase G2 autoproteolytic cleavage domain-containing protein, partial [Pseudophaeobacter sp. 1A16562]|uniref:peptidase G2 autoproteolytic cleavage domain-containing protein n=1 Tax=Pseudophaeobacter sp. 1A16562 TaxID=3098143 RepID=UPI0034D7843E
SFTGDTLLVRTSRAGSSAFDLIDARSNGGSDAEFRVRGDGTVTSDVGFTGGGADYAEYFEWVDGNLAGEDRRGLSVVLDGDKIRLALPGEDPIGVISANPSVIGDGDIDRWKGKYLKDAFGAYIWEDYEALSWSEVVTETETFQKQASEAQERTREVIEVVDGVAVKTVVTETVQVPLFDEFPLVDESGAPVLGGNGSQLIHREPRMVEVQEETTKEEKHSYAADEVPDGVTVPADAERVTQQRRKLNPDYDPSQEYTPRADRPEWDTVGLMGKLRLLKGQPTGSRWIKMRDVSADVEEWLVR